MTVMINKYGPFTQAQGAQTIELPGEQRGFAFQSIALRYVLTSTLDDAIPSAGSFVLEARRGGSNIWEDISGVTSIPAPTVGGWDLLGVAIEAIRITPTAFDADKSYFVTMNGVN